jgi:hypothetical protein
MAVAMRSRRRAVAGVLVVAASMLVAALGVNGSGGRAASPAATTASTPQLVDIRAAHHPGHDRVVFQFAGPLPSRRYVRYVDRLIGDPSGLPVRIAGRAILEATFSPAAAHNDTGTATAPERISFALPNVMTAVRSGDFEAVLSYGIGLARRTPFHTFTLTHPSRIVIDISTPFATVLKKVYFVNQPRFVANTPPFVTAVLRPVLPGTPATGVMDRLFAGPTPRESSLRLVRSGASSFTALSIAATIARVRLTGGCSSGGSTITIANEIFPTLKQFSTVRFVKIYDPTRHTENPTARRDSIPQCLEP